jgi:hypothetical protein
MCEELRKSLLLFFDDILIYSQNIKEHVTHLSKVFEKLRAHKLYAKMSKCTFGMPQVEYLSHIISKEGVANVTRCRVRLCLCFPFLYWMM